MSFELANFKIGDFVEVTDYVANGSFASLKENVNYLDSSSPEKYAILVRTADFTRGWNGDYVWVDQAAYSFLRKSKLEPGDLVLCNVGSVGIVFRVPQLNFPMSLGPNSVVCKTKDSEIIRQEYLYYYFLSPKGQSLLEELSGGSTVQPKFNKTVLRNSIISVPNLPHQDFISELLGAIDSKIQNNNVMAKTLEEMAQGVFRSWFLDFEPVKAKIAGKKIEGLDVETAALFPASMVDSDLGEIPSGWEVVPSTDMFEILGGGTPKTTNEHYWNGEIPWFSVVDVPNEGGCFFIKTAKTITEAGLKGSAAKLVRPGITIISARGTVGKTAIVAKPSTFNQSCYGVEGKYGDFLTYLLLRNQISRLQSISHGGMFDTITRDTFSSVFVAKPSEKLMSSFESKVEPLFFKIRALQIETQKLTEFRDALLPRLISGALAIPDEMLNA
jgi:restriction endonuclease S subunit